MNKEQKSLLGLGLMWIVGSLLIFAVKDLAVLGIICLISGIAVACFAIAAPHIIEKKKQKAANLALDNDVRNSQSGETSGLFQMGVRYWSGDGVPQDYKKAYDCWMQAAKKGHAAAQYNLGVMLEQGKGVAANDDAALSWFQQAADQGYAGAIHEIGIFHQKGKCGFAASDEEAFPFFEKAAKAGNKIAQYHIGLAYLEGRGCETNRQRAINFLSRSAEQNYSLAENKLRELIGDKSGF